jgi:type I restriction enzyme S subunit
MSWKMVPLGKCCDVVSGATPKRQVLEYWGGEIAWATPKDISALDEPFLDDTPEHITAKGYKSCSARLMPEGAILFSSRAPIGLAAIAGREMCTNQGFKSLIPGSDVDSKYLYHCMKRVAPRIADLGNGATFKEVSKGIVSSFEIPLPPLEKQKRIAAILDKADGIRRKRQQAMAMADEFLRSVFLDMFGDPAMNPKGWDVKPLSDVILGSPNNGIFKKNKEYGEGLPVVWVEELYKGYGFDTSRSRQLNPSKKELAKYGLKNGDILFCRSSLNLEGVGYNNIYLGSDDEALFECHLIRVTPDPTKIDPVFMNYQLWSTNMRRRTILSAKTVTMSTVNQEIINDIELISPPVEMQAAFSEIVTTLEMNKKPAEDFLQDSENCFHSLNSSLMKGEA